MIWIISKALHYSNKKEKKNSTTKAEIVHHKSAKQELLFLFSVNSTWKYIQWNLCQ